MYKFGVTGREVIGLRSLKRVRIPDEIVKRETDRGRTGTKSRVKYTVKEFLNETLVDVIQYIGKYREYPSTLKRIVVKIVDIN